MSTHIVALNPAQLPAAQARVTDWMDARVGRARAELADAQVVLDAAMSSGFDLEPHKRLVDKAAKRLTYYSKLQAALKDGYLIVPNLPLEMIAVRTNEKRPKRGDTTAGWADFSQAGRALPAGTGRYVDDKAFRSEYTAKKADGTSVVKYFASAFDETIDFPLDVARPEIMEATRLAMAGGLFDQIGVCRNQSAGGDPIVCGVIRDATRRGKQVTFFIAWTVNPEDL